MILVSIDSSVLGAEERAALWSMVVELSIEQDADFFSIEPVSWNRSDPRGAVDQLRSAPVDAAGLRPIAHLVASIVEVGPTVMSLNLYAGRGWVAGVSDWGDDMDALFESDAWLRLKSILDSSTPPIAYDTAEAARRPPPAGVKRRP